MSSDPKSNLSQNSLSESLDQEIDRLLAAGLENLQCSRAAGNDALRRRASRTSPRSRRGRRRQRQWQLRALGACSARSPSTFECPRSRTGNLRPSSIPPPYERGYSDEVQALLLGVLSSARSINAAKTALKKMGLGSCSEDLDAVASGFVEELELVNSRPIDPDMLAIFLDGKYVEVKQDERLRSACVYLVIGLHRDGKKKVLGCFTKHGGENLEIWKAVLRSLVERGLRRVMVVVHDDFSGLLGLTRGMFPNSDVQLCTVHLLRNAKTHLSKEDSAEFTKRFPPSNTLGTLRSPELGSRSSVNDSKNPPRPSSRSYVRSESITSSSSTTQMVFSEFSRPPTPSRPSTSNSNPSSKQRRLLPFGGDR